MAKLPWQHNRSRTRSGHEKVEAANPQDWFSRTGGEPSRQALADLLKEHKREKSSSSSGSQVRSRGNTISSLEWNAVQTRSEVGSEVQSSRSNSPVETREGSVFSSLERPESSTKTFLSKGSQLLRRKGSKMSLSSAGSSSNLSQLASSRSTFVQNSSSNTSQAQAGDLRKAISAPFNFQHVTHTEQNQFPSLGRIEESELSQQFTAAMSSRPASSLMGIHAQAIGAVHDATESDPSFNAVTPQDPKNTQLPTTPPRPSPPPKDVLTVASQNQTLESARSSPRSPAFPQAQLLTAAISDATEHQPAVLKTSASSSSILDAKPLPQLPSVIHAVSTNDDTARTMITAPLPTPPGPVNGPGTSPRSTRAFHRPQKSSVTLRPTSLYPSSKVSMPNLLGQQEPSTPLITLPRHHSDMALFEQARVAQEKTEVESFAGMHLESADWETAIDEAWDSVDGTTEGDDGLYGDESRSRANSNMYLLPVSRTDDGATSTSSTPLMMDHSVEHRSSDHIVTTPETNQEGTRLSVVPEQKVLTGLGITHFHGSPPVSVPNRTSATPSFHLVTKRSTATFGSNGTLSRSSSQDSMLMSLASSVIGTQRSSNSSVGDYESIAPSLKSSSNKASMQLSTLPTVPSVSSEASTSRARPESGCLPPDIAQQLKLMATVSASSEKTASKPQPDVGTVTPQKANPRESLKADKYTDTNVTSTPKSPRPRSNTGSQRPRTSSRVSYSLFPMPNTASATPATVVKS